MGFIDTIKGFLIKFEGLELKRHLVDGKAHIGVGHNLEIEQTEEELSIIGSADVETITVGQAHALLEVDINDALEDLSFIFTEEEMATWDNTRKLVLISMVFQLGVGGLKKFKKFIAAVKANDWDTAADESLDSLAAKQTPARWQHQAELLHQGDFGESVGFEEELTLVDQVADLRKRLATLEQAWSTWHIRGK